MQTNQVGCEIGDENLILIIADCTSYTGCLSCLDDPACGWYNYTNSCQNRDSGLVLQTDTCYDYNPQGKRSDLISTTLNRSEDACRQKTSCGECIGILLNPAGDTNIHHHCGWNGTSCAWAKSEYPPFNINITTCPWDPAGESKDIMADPE